LVLLRHNTVGAACPQNELDTTHAPLDLRKRTR